MNKEKEIETVEEIDEVETEEHEELSDEEISTDDTELTEDYSDSFEEFYDEEAEGEETEDEGSEDDEVIEEEDSESDDNVPGDEPEKPSEDEKKISEIEEAARNLLKSVGVENVEDPVKELKKLTAETLGLSDEEYNRKLAEQVEWNRQIQRDIEAIHEAYPETKRYKTLRDLPNARKFAKLMDDPELQLDAVGAFAASHQDIVNAHRKRTGKNLDLAGTKLHINSSVPKRAKDTSVYISKSEMASLRETFGEDLTDAQIRALYKKVSK